MDTGKIREIPADTVIAAVGERVDTALFESAGCAVSEKGLPVTDAGMKTSADGVYAIGDARRGPATVVEGIADAMAAAYAIQNSEFCDRRYPNQDLDGCSMGFVTQIRDLDKSSTIHNYEKENSEINEGAYLFKKGRIAEDLSVMPDWRCLGCPTVCEACADVCPNRANVAIHVPGRCQAQIIHVDGMCNECGNCAVFCPYNGKPYRDKFTLFWSEEDFDNSENEGFLMIGEDTVKLRLDGQEQTVSVNELDSVSKDAAEVIRTIVKDYGYLIK